MAMYMESMVQGYHDYVIHNSHTLVLEAPSFAFKTFTLDFGGFDGGTDLFKGPLG